MRLAQFLYRPANMLVFLLAILLNQCQCGGLDPNLGQATFEAPPRNNQPPATHTPITQPLIQLAQDEGYNFLATMLRNLKDHPDQVVINKPDNLDNDKTTLHQAAELGNPDIVKALLDRGANINSTDAYGLTPLHLAVLNKRLEAVQALLDKSAYVNAQDSYQRSPLHHAAAGGYLAIVEALVSKGADVNAKSKFGYTPLHLARLNNHTAVINFLLGKQAL